MADRKKRNSLQRVLIIASGLAFLSLMVIPLVGLLGNSKTEQPISNPNVPANAELKQLQAEAAGYEQVLKREPNNVSALQGVIAAKLKMGDYAGAIPHLETAAKLYPDNPQILQPLAQAYAMTKNAAGVQKVKDQLEKMLAKNPDDPGMLQAVAQMRLATNDLAGGVEMMEKLAKIYPQDEKLKQAIVMLKQEQNKQITPEMLTPLPTPSP
jgi:cytochrome c-type biogenesis protein CcmH/NrfG